MAKKVLLPWRDAGDCGDLCFGQDTCRFASTDDSDRAMQRRLPCSARGVLRRSVSLCAVDDCRCAPGTRFGQQRRSSHFMRRTISMLA
jgi:hypothetical protein